MPLGGQSAVLLLELFLDLGDDRVASIQFLGMRLPGGVGMVPLISELGDEVLELGFEPIDERVRGLTLLPGRRFGILRCVRRQSRLCLRGGWLRFCRLGRRGGRGRLRLFGRFLLALDNELHSLHAQEIGREVLEVPTQQPDQNLASVVAGDR